MAKKIPKNEKWIKSKTCARGNTFYWRCNDDGEYIIKRTEQGHVIRRFSPEEYDLMLQLVNSNGDGGTPLGSRPDGDVPANSLGQLLTTITGSTAIRPLCAHLAAIGNEKEDLRCENRGRGPGRGVWLYPKKYG